MKRQLQSRRGHGENSLFTGVLILLLTASLGAAAPAQFNAGPNPMHQSPRPTLPEIAEPQMDVPPLSPAANARRQRDLTKSNYEKLKQEAVELTNLAKSLQDELDNSNADVLSLKVVQNAEKIEKLAKKIRGSALENTN
jgi:hypothetical protein